MSGQGYVQEVRVLTDPNMKHRHIIRLMEVFEDVGFVYVITDPCDPCGENLLKKVAQLNSVSEREVANWLLPLVKAVNHAHSNGTVCFL